jgi:peptide/nickel transport system permease protein
MQAYILRRVLATIPVLVVVALFAFTLLRVIPGDPAAVLAGHEATAEDVARIRSKLGLDRPIHIQLVAWFSNLLQGDLGVSIRSNMPVLSLIAKRVEPTLSLTLLTELVAISLAVPLGVLAAWKANTWIDRVVMIFASVGFSLPVFWLGFILIWIFGLWAFGLDQPILPVAGYRPFADGFGTYLKYLILPSAALGIALMALIARMTRASVLEILKEDYVRTARAKGLGEKLVLTRHALRNASLPIITVIGLGVAALLSGAVVTESVFAIPGMGRLVVDAIAARDYPVIQGMIIVIATVYVFINLLVDISYAYLDPRIRY